jgi:protein gp37
MVKRFQPQEGECMKADSLHTAAHDPRCYVEVKQTVLRDVHGKYIRTTPYPKGFAPTMHSHNLERPRIEKTPRRIFVGSMADMFGDWTPDEWLAAVFRSCYEAPWHKYMFLTKNPARYTELAMSGLLPRGDNYWFGTTVTTEDDPYWFSSAHRTFVSIEPILGEFSQSPGALNSQADWIIVGAMTGPSASKHRPRREWIDNIVKWCAEKNVPIFLKNNLRKYFPDEPFPQEYPAAMMETTK